MPVEVTGPIYFTATYLLVIVAVCFKSTWLIIFANVKLNEPFYQLSQPGGADSTTGLFFEFLATGFPVDHFKAGFSGNWTSWFMIVSYAVLLLMLIVPAVAAEAFSVQNVVGHCVNGKESDSGCAQRVWTISERPVRILELALVFMGFAVLLVLVMQMRRRHTMSLKRTNLENIGHMLKDPPTLAVFRSADPNASHEECNNILTQHRYRLEIQASGHNLDSDILKSTPEEVATKSHQFATLEHLWAPFSRIQPTLDLVIPGFIILLLLVMIMSYSSGSINDSTLTRFFKSPAFGAKFFLIATTTMLGIAFCRVEYEVRVLSIYRALYRSKDPQTILSRSLHGTPFTQTWSAIKHGDWVCALVPGVAGFGVQGLSIVIANVPWHAGKSPESTIARIVVSLALLALMAVSLVSVAFWRRSLPTQIPRMPCTLADICVLMAHNRIPGLHLGMEGKENVLKP